MLKLFKSFIRWKRRRAYPALSIGKQTAFSPSWKRRSAALDAFFIAKLLKIAKYRILYRFFVRNTQNPGLNWQKRQNLRLFTNNGICNKPPAFFTLMSRASDTNSPRWTFDYQSGMAIDFIRTKKRWAVYFTRIKKTLGGIIFWTSDVQNPRITASLNRSNS